MEDKKAAKKIIKIYKKHPEFYSKEEIRYAKMMRKLIKRKEKKNEHSEIGDSNPKGRRDNGVRGKGEQPKKPRQSKGGWFINLLHKAWSLVSL